MTLRRIAKHLVLPLASVCLAVVGAVSYVHATSPQVQASAGPAAVAPQRAVIDRYCITCHNEKLRAQGTVPVSFEGRDLANVGADADIWEKVVRKLRGGVMPPVGRPRPDEPTRNAFVAWLETELDRAAAARPYPGRSVIHRLNRAEYTNVVRDLLALELDARSLLPADATDQHGFDNNAAVLTVSPMLLERYMSAARRVSRLAVGDPTVGPGFASETYEIPKTLVQDDRMSEDLPFGSRGGVAIRHHFPLDGEYVIKLRLRRQLYSYIIGMGRRHDLEIRLDGRRIKLFRGGEAPGTPAADTFIGRTAGDPEWEEYMQSADAGMEVRVPVKAGTRVVGVSFINKFFEPDGVLMPRQNGFGLSVNQLYDGNAALGSLAITGPYTATGPGDTPSRRKIFLCRPVDRADEEPCATKILSTLARRAYRRPVTTEDVQTLLSFYQAGRSEGEFDLGIQRAVDRLLVDPEFLFRIARDPVDVAPGTTHRLSDLELASRLSFFLWSSIPDEELLGVAEKDRLHDPAVLEQQVRRMLADSRSKVLVGNFGVQWLQLRGLEAVAPDQDVFPEWDESLREDFRRQTELFLESLLRADRSVVDLLKANHTFVNERLARHYQIPGIYGNHFRRVELPDDDVRAGLFGHGSVLTVSSYPTRTSPVLRGKWVLDNILGIPPPPPPPNVPALQERGETGKPASVRERLEQHRKNPACAVCHSQMDPMGFALENFDAIGRWRARSEAGTLLDTSGVFPDGAGFEGMAQMRGLIVTRFGEEFVGTVTEKLLAYALGRGIEFYDWPAIRKITREAASSDYRWSALVLGIVKSTPFQMRRAES